MARRKAAKNCNIKPWLSAERDCQEGRFIQVGNSFLLNSDQVQRLKPTARWLYLTMCMEAGGKREFTYTHGSAKKYGFKKSSFELAVKQLIDAEFIIRLENEERLQYAPSRFKFTDAWKLKTAPKN